MRLENNTMRYLSVCSGIEAATQAWHPLGWQCAGVSEIEKFPRAVLEQRLGAQPVDDDHRYREGSNTIPMFGDFTKIEAHHVGPVDLLVGGTPCQSFSVAGKRLGLDDPRGNLTLEFLALAERIRPTWIVWENVPGVLSHDEGRTMGTFLRLVGECGFRWAYRVLDAQYVRTRAFPWAVPQRRRRVFLVGYSGAADIDPRAVLFDRESLRGDPAPRREAGQGVAPTIAARTRGGGGLGTDFDCDGGLFAHAQRSFSIMPMNSGKDYKARETDVAQPIMAGGPVGGNQGGDFVAAIQERAVSENPDAGPDGKGWRDDGAAYTLEARQRPQAVAFAENTRGEVRLQGGDGQVSPQLTTGGGKPGQGHPAIAYRTTGNDGCYETGDVVGALDTQTDPNGRIIAFSAKDHGGDAQEECSPTLRAGGHSGSHANAGVMPAIAFDMRGREGGAMPEGPHETANIRAADGGSSRSYVAANWRVRRLTPVECERLQGFPDNYSRIEWRGKPADKCPDGPRYKALGNSMAVNVMGWIGERIQMVEDGQ